MDNARAHAGAQRNGHKAFTLAPGPCIVFRQCRAVCIVLDIKRDGQIVVEQLSQRHVLQRQVAGIADGAGTDLHRARYAHAYRRDLVQRHPRALCQLLRQRHDRPCQRLLVGNGGHLHLLHSQQLAVLVRQARLQIRSTDVHAHILHCFSLLSFTMASILLSNWVTKSRAAL